MSQNQKTKDKVLRIIEPSQIQLFSNFPKATAGSSAIYASNHRFQFVQLPILAGGHAWSRATLTPCNVD